MAAMPPLRCLLGSAVTMVAFASVAIAQGGGKQVDDLARRYLAPPAAQPALSVPEATSLVTAIMADPAKREALCAYEAALEKAGSAMSGLSSPPPSSTGETSPPAPGGRADAMRTLGAAQGQVHLAADRVDPRFDKAMEMLRIGNPSGYLPIAVRLRQLCPGR